MDRFNLTVALLEVAGNSSCQEEEAGAAQLCSFWLEGVLLVSRRFLLRCSQIS